ncbi:MAG: DUF502 domain-containing protein [Halobacteria archaeon]|nr:DUF502 domain-containing protein [Halobacteria archaeon]
MNYGKVIRNSLVTGLALLAPLAITVLVLQFVYNWVVGYVNPIIRSTSLTDLTGNIEIVAQFLTVVVILGLVTLLGYVAKRGVGERAFGEFDDVMNRIPFVRSIYSSVRQVSDTLMNRQEAYDRVVLVEWPREGVRSIGFVAGKASSAVKEVAGDDTYEVFIPMSPNPTAGHLAIFSEDEMHDLDMTVGQGLRIVVTSGLAGRGESGRN